MEHENNNFDSDTINNTKHPTAETLEDTIISTPVGDYSMNSTSSSTLPEDGLHHNLAKKESSSTLKEFKITDVKSMAEEVNGILNSMETYMSRQRQRRLLKLKPPSRISRNWYFAAIVIPITGYATYKLTKGNYGLATGIAAEVYAKFCTFFTEHVSEPLLSM